MDVVINKSDNLVDVGSLKRGDGFRYANYYYIIVDVLVSEVVCFNLTNNQKRIFEGYIKVIPVEMKVHVSDD